MGVAKRRGTFEERKAAAIIRNKLEAERREKEFAERQAAKPPEQRQKEAMLTMLFGDAISRANSRTFQSRRV